jgi:hypothetical protein
MKRLFIGELILTIVYLLVAFVNDGLDYFTLITIPVAYLLLVIYMPNKKDLK